MAATQGRANDGAGEEALATMRARSIPINPRNFAVWFTYAAGLVPELRVLMDGMIEQNLALNDRAHAWLHDKFCALVAPPRPSAEAEVADAAGAAMTGVLDQLAKAGKDAETYEKALGDYEKSLTRSKSAAGASGSIDGLRDATRKMHDENARLKSQLADYGRQIGDLKTKLEDVHLQSVTDKLTGIANRRAFDRQLAAEMDQSRQRDTPLTVLMLDVDKFKAFNDNFGHTVGDEVLRLVARTLTDGVKGRDMPARYGGEEFAILLPNTALDQAATVAEQIRAEMASRRIVRRNSTIEYGQVTLSIGVALLNEQDDAESFLHRADQALYQAKRTGRNRVVTERAMFAGAAAPKDQGVARPPETSRMAPVT